MAGTVKYTLIIDVSNGGYADSKNTTNASFEQTNIGAASGVRDIGTIEEVVDFGDVGTEGWCYMKNLDGTNFIEWGPESAGSMAAIGKLEPGEEAWFRLKPGVVLRAKADTAACLLDARIYED